MKKIIPTTLWILVALIPMSCSTDSNDIPKNDGPTKENKKNITVLKNYTSTETYKGDSDTFIVDFTYDDAGNVTNHYTTYEAKAGNTTTKSKSECTYTYNNKKQLIGIVEVNDKNKRVKNYTFEYDTKGQMTKSIDIDNNITLEFKHNSSKQITEAMYLSNKLVSTTNFEYDHNGNLINAGENDNANIVESYTYDQHNNPFKNMPINIPLHYINTTAFDIMYYYKPTNNIQSYNIHNSTVGDLTYEYNEDNYPISSVTKNNRGIKKEQFSYNQMTVNK
ncbi:hypothetical protein [Myroides sp. N17-2]|uniref:hypothetical protein n=1 Tax=Myroides sp. N17-2 TaxID=2030799 RepID=UPI000EFAF8AE|nr:hypothetical protein [Myroides sp. N17-2]